LNYKFESRSFKPFEILNFQSHFSKTAPIPIDHKKKRKRTKRNPHYNTITMASTTATDIPSAATTASIAAEASRTSLKRARHLFDDGDPKSVFLPRVVVDPEIHQLAKDRRRRQAVGGGGTAAISSVDSTSGTGAALSQSLVVASKGEKKIALALRGANDHNSKATNAQAAAPAPAAGGILVRSSARDSATHISTPTWHAPWKLSTVLSSHLGWVRCLAFSPENKYMASGAADRTIKIWDFPKASVGASDALQLTLTGHISPIRGLAFSPRHPYLFSCAEDKQVKCWDLETNQVIRHYHGHLSGIFCLALHPTLDLLVTGGRDAVARVWDMRTKVAVHVLTGHEHTVASVLTKSTFPQIISGSHDTTIKLWDLVAGKCFTTLTHHQKAIRALVQPSFENTFTSGAADCLKQWQGKDGRFLKSFTGHKTVVNAMAVNDDGVLVSGGDDGSMHFWDYKTGYTFQQAQARVQPGSLAAENSIMATAFDLTGTRLVTGEADKSIKIWKQDEDASELSHPVDMTAWRKKCIAQSKQRY
jgi:pleiotropic regulator 1